MSRGPEPLFPPTALLCALAVACGLACGAGGPAGAASPAGGGAQSFALNTLWDDGRAEIDAYDASLPRYGIPRSLTAYLIVVKEDFSRKQLVKADAGHDKNDLMPVLKLNHVLDTQTGIYTYHQMASCFFDRATMELVKLSFTSNEWCGNSYKEYTRRPGGGVLHVHTYWDGQAEASYPLPAGPDLVFYDQLPLWIRSLPQKAGTGRTIRLIPTQIESRGPKPEVVAATLRSSNDEAIETPAGRFSTLRWELQTGSGPPDRYWTSRDFPFVLVAWDRSDGGRYRLKWTQRLAYWTLNHPGEERFLEGPGPQAPLRRP